jgi:hypothetical protein
VRLSQDLANLTPQLQRLMNPRALRGVWQNFVIGQTSWARPWSIYVLNEWVRRHMTGTIADRDSSATASSTPAVRPDVAPSVAAKSGS